MSFFSPPNYRLPGVKSYIRRCPDFKVRRTSLSLSVDELVDKATENWRAGILKPGDPFPRPDEFSRISGAPLMTCVEAITSLIRSGKIRQLASGSLIVAPPPAY